MDCNTHHKENQMSKVEMIAHLIMAFVMLVLCHDKDGWLFEAGLVFAGALIGAVAWVALNEVGVDDAE
jgi:hypothetical protein